MTVMKTKQKSVADIIRKTKLFLLDLDGTVYHEDVLIPGALDFIEKLHKAGIDYVFLTNNSSKSALDYLKKIRRLGIPVTKENIFTSGQATGIYLTGKKRHPRIYTVGTKALCNELAIYGCLLTDGSGLIDFVVVGYDTELTYEKISIACRLIDGGAAYVATNPDLVCPIHDGRSLPDCGTICEMIGHATGKKPVVIGKPQSQMVDIVCNRLSIPKNRTAMIGDRLYTDIAVAHNANVFSIAVLTGETTRSEIKKAPIKPDLIIESIDDLNCYFV